MDDLLSLATSPVQPAEVTELWGIFNDPEFFEARFQNGTIHPMLRENLLDNALLTFDMPGVAKRNVQLINRERTEAGRLHIDGPVQLKVQLITKVPWRTVEGAEFDEIDDGKSPSGR